MYLIFDTETSNLPKSGQSIKDPFCARIIQIAAILLDDKFEEKSCFKSLIQLSNHYQISAGAFDAHGINHEMCQKFGIPIEAALCVFDSMAVLSKVQVAHNFHFDSRMLEFEVTNILDGMNSTLTNPFCTMLASTPHCKLPGRNGQQYKWPKLSEAYKFFVGEDLVDAHDALNDVRATAKVFRHLVEKGLVTLN